LKAVASAPSKVIITGEHFVVHGAWALAAAIGKHVRVEVEDSDRLRVGSDKFGERAQGALHPTRVVVETMAREFSFKPNLSVTIASEVPEGAGLGSSASTMVSLVAALSTFHSLDLGIKDIAGFAMVGEREIHGKPSGIDAEICTRGGVLLFRPGSEPRVVSLKGERRLLVVFSGKRRSTRRLIGHVSDVKENFPSLFSGLASAAGEVSSMASRRLAEGDMEGLGRLMTFNHAVLSTVGVSTKELDGLVDLLLSLGCHGAKLTGAGGGGSVLAVAPRGKEKRIISGVKGRGFEAFAAVIPVGGVRSWQEQ
jgi:mevalonate kinase